MARRTFWRTAIVKLRMWYADIRGHHGKRYNYEPGEWYMGRHNRRNITMAYELKEYLKAINESKEDLMKSDETWIKKYPAYIINRCLSMFWDTLPQANEMNGYHFLTNRFSFNF